MVKITKTQFEKWGKDFEKKIMSFVNSKFGRDKLSPEETVELTSASAQLDIKNKFLNSEKVNNMVLKTKEYWENTVQKISFWGSENYFYEVNKKKKSPRQNQNSNNQSGNNKNVWKKVAWICLPILFFFFCLFLLVKWISKKQK
jgi:hypothetical protein